MNKENKIEMIEKSEQKNLRRKFLKKAAYSAPALVMLGQAIKPNALRAECVEGYDTTIGIGGSPGGGSDGC